MPNFEAIKQVLADKETVTYYGFLVSMAKSEDLNRAIGKKYDSSYALKVTFYLVDMLILLSVLNHSHHGC